MKGEPIPDSDHVARYCKASTVEHGEISATAFMLRETDEYLSVNWLEELRRSDRASQIRNLQELYASKLRVGTAAQIAILNVGIVRTKVERDSSDRRVLRVLHDPEPDDPSHSGIYDIPYDDEIVAELIAQVLLEHHPARL